MAMEKVISKRGKGVICDNSTRWNSTYMVAQRLLKVTLSRDSDMVTLCVVGSVGGTIVGLLSNC